MGLTELPILFPNDIVMLKGRKEKYKFIRQISHKNYLAMGEDGKEWKLPITGVIKAPEGTEFKDFERPEAPDLFLGDPVTLREELADAYPGKWVVIKLGDGTVNVAKLGGRQNSYLRSIPRYKVQLDL